MVASGLFKFVILLISVVSGTNGLGPLYPSLPTLPGGIYGRGIGGGGNNANLIRQRIEECGHRFNGRPYICYDTDFRNFHCIDESQVCDGYADCIGKDDEQGCANSRRARSYSFTTTTTTVAPTSTSILTHVTTSATTETTTTTTRTSTIVGTSTVQVKVIYGQSSSTATSTQQFILANALTAIYPTAGVVIGAFTCLELAIPVIGTLLAGNNDYLYVTSVITETMTAQATFTCSPTSTIYM